MFINLEGFGGGLYMEEAGNDGVQGGGAPAQAASAAPGTDNPAEPPKEPEAKPSTEGTQEEAPQDTEAHPMDTYIEQYKDNPGLSLALSYLKEQGINPDDPAFNLAETTGDFTLLEAMLATKGAVGYQNVVGILQNAVEEHQKAVVANYEQTESILTEELGESKEAVFQWVKDNADPEERELLNDLFEVGGIAAKAAALFLKDAYAGSGNTIKATSLATPNAPTGGEAITRAEFAKEMQKLSRKTADPYNHPDYQRLWQRRQAGMRRGL